MKARLCGLVPMASLEGGGELAAASLQRFLAEVLWLPTALLPAAGVSWTALDAGGRGPPCKTVKSRPRSTFISATGLNRTGRGAPFAGGRQGDGAFSLGRPLLWDYREVDGLRLPHQAEVAWLLPEGSHVYWRAHIVRFELDRS